MSLNTVVCIKCLQIERPLVPKVVSVGRLHHDKLMFNESPEPYVRLHSEQHAGAVAERL